MFQSLQTFFMAAPAPPESVAQSLWLIIAFPLAGALACGVVGRALGRSNVALIACGAVGASFLLSVLAFWTVNDPNVQAVSPHALTNVTYALGHDYGTWFSAGGFQARFGFWVDHLSGVMALTVTGVSFLIHIYSVGYMSHDPGYARYFAYLNLFVAMMMTLVLADNLVLLFVGWEGVGLCSYLLIGFWYTDPAKAWAGRKAFLFNRVGDFSFLIGMLLLVLLTSAFSRQATDGNFAGGRVERYRTGLANTGPLNFLAVEALSRGLVTPGAPGAKVTAELPIAQGPLRGFTFGGVVTAILLLFMLGAAGKSAQIPLYVWLPDAMAGPTPVSALIHAATMVTAGVYLFTRLSFLLVLSPQAMAVVAMVGAATALWAALIAFAQDDIKKVLAYSTVSQLGFMFMAVGMGVFWAAIFHLVTHAFFKACLFLDAGSVMHGNADETDIKKLGGLWREMRTTWWTFLVAMLAITGIVPLSGYFSKDAILHGIHATRLTGLEWTGTLVWIAGLAAAFCTAFYMTRLYLLTFHGKRAEDAKVAHAHESGPSMTVPLVALAALSVVGLVWGLPLMRGAGGEGEPVLENFLSPVLFNARRNAMAMHSFEVEREGGMLAAYLTASAIAIGAFLVAVWMYRRFFPAYRASGRPTPWWARWARGAAAAKFKVDEIYDFLLIRPIKQLSFFLYRVVDSFLIDTVAVRGSAWVTYRVGTALRYIQTGDVQGYAAVMAAALVIGVAYVIFGLR